MQFNSISFLFMFLPIFLAIYYIVPHRIRNAVLLIGSVIFYGIGVQWSPLPMLLLLGITVTTYFAGLALERPNCELLFWLIVVILLGILVFFKCYKDGAYMPIGMSFYLFQIGAYLACIFRGSMPAQKNLLDYSTGILMFPKIISGPIMEPYAVSKQTHSRHVTVEHFHKGLQLMILGMALKVIVANRIGGLWNKAVVNDYQGISTILAWLCLIAYAMKLYFDFFGYSLMAVGIARMLGFYLPQNFDNPYASKSVSEFYRRWHITLGAWFREYIYIPLGGNRKGNARTIINLLVVWILTGLWHGIGGNYLLWAGIIVFFVILEKLFLGKWLHKSVFLCHLYTVTVILLSWVPFAIGDSAQMITFFAKLFGEGATANALDYKVWVEKYAPLLISGVLLATPLPKMLWKKIEDCWAADVICFVLFWVCVYFIATASQDPFMYGQY